MFFDELSYTVLSRKTKEGLLKLFYNERNMGQCKILIQDFISWKQRLPPAPIPALFILDLAGIIN